MGFWDFPRLRHPLRTRVEIHRAAILVVAEVLAATTLQMGPHLDLEAVSTVVTLLTARVLPLLAPARTRVETPWQPQPSSWQTSGQRVVPPSTIVSARPPTRGPSSAKMSV